MAEPMTKAEFEEFYFSRPGVTRELFANAGVFSHVRSPNRNVR